MSSREDHTAHKTKVQNPKIKILVDYEPLLIVLVNQNMIYMYLGKNSRQISNFLKENEDVTMFDFTRYLTINYKQICNIVVKVTGTDVKIMI